TVDAAKRALKDATHLDWIDRIVPEAFVIRTDKGRWVEVGQLTENLRTGEHEGPVELRLKVLLTRTETSPEDVHGMLHAQVSLTRRGGAPGEVFGALIPAMEADSEKETELRPILDWCDELAAPFRVWANADYPR